MSYRYAQWDGSQDLPPFDADELMEMLADDLIEDGSLRRALQRLMRQGAEHPSGHLPGLQDILSRLRARRQESLQRHDLGSLVDDLKQRLDRVVETERGGIERRVEDGRQRLAEQGERADQSLQQILEDLAGRKRQFLDGLPQDLPGAINALSQYEFMDDGARAQFQELLQMLQQQVMQSHFQGMQQALQGLTPEQMRDMKEMLRDLNRMLRERMEGGEPDFQRFKERYGQYFDPRVNSLDDLIASMQQRMAQMESLLQSMTPEMRRSLEELMKGVLQDAELRQEMEALAQAMQELVSPGELSRRYRFQGDQPVTLAEAMQLMEQLQQMDGLERQLQGARDAADLEEIDAGAVSALAGEEARQMLEHLKQLQQILEDAGYLEQRGGRLELTAAAIRKIGQKALRDIFAHLKKDGLGKHETGFAGRGGERVDESKLYEFGDPFLVDLEKTLMNALAREGARTPVAIQARDFEVYRAEMLTDSSTVLMLDLSRSMLYTGCYQAAKRLALALDSLIRYQFPRDTLHIVGFSYLARELKPADLARANWSEDEQGTNLQHGLMLARRLLARHKGGNRQVIVVTDGEPTAHLENGQPVFSYPPLDRTILETLREAGRCARENIHINTFMLERNPRLLNFVDQMTRINRGRAYYVSPERLGEFILVDYVANKRKVIR